MCGIAGFADFSKNTNPSTVDKMTGSIVYRGPDSSGSFISKNDVAGLGIRRLSIIDLKTGDQPIKNEDGTVVVVFNGEIYNYKSLRDELIKSGHKFKTRSDTEVLVHLYEKYGDKMAKYLNGMFAFAIWDDKKQKLFLSRDRSGIKPLYYFNSGKNLIFGSEAKAILAHPFYKKSVNTDSLSLYLYYGYLPGIASMYSGIKKLLPGYSLTFSQSGIKTTKYFEIDVKKDVSNNNLDELLENSVKNQLVADVPVGVFLSGGLDSSLVSYYISKYKKLKSFSIGFEDESLDESKYAYKVAKRLGTKHYNEIFKADDAVEISETLTKLLDEPLADASLLPTYKVSKLARKYVKVALSGDGGDELFGGYPQYQGHIVAQFLKFLPQTLLNSSANLFGFLPSPYKWKGYDKTEVYKNFLGNVKNDSVARQLIWMRTFFLGNNELTKKPSFEWLEEKVEKINGKGKTSKSAQIVDFYTYLRDAFLVKSDRASMYNSLEIRVPFLDNDIIDYAFATNRSHVNLAQTKIQLRKLISEKLPELDDIAKRPKKGFGLPLAKWMRGELKGYVGDRVSNPKLYDYIEKEKIDTIWNKHQEGKVNNAGTLWQLSVLSGWLNHWG